VSSINAAWPALLKIFGWGEIFEGGGDRPGARRGAPATLDRRPEVGAGVAKANHKRSFSCAKRSRVEGPLTIPRNATIEQIVKGPSTASELLRRAVAGLAQDDRFFKESLSRRNRAEPAAFVKNIFQEVAAHGPKPSSHAHRRPEVDDYPRRSAAPTADRRSKINARIAISFRLGW